MALLRGPSLGLQAGARLGRGGFEGSQALVVMGLQALAAFLKPGLPLGLVLKEPRALLLGQLLEIGVLGRELLLEPLVLSLQAPPLRREFILALLLGCAHLG